MEENEFNVINLTHSPIIVPIWREMGVQLDETSQNSNIVPNNPKHHQIYSKIHSQVDQPEEEEEIVNVGALEALNSSTGNHHNNCNNRGLRGVNSFNFRIETGFLSIYS